MIGTYLSDEIELGAFGERGGIHRNAEAIRQIDCFGEVDHERVSVAVLQLCERFKGRAVKDLYGQRAYALCETELIEEIDAALMPNSRHASVNSRTTSPLPSL